MNLIGILSKKFRRPTLKPPKMYVLVRKDLNPVYSCVQGSHAISQFALDHRDLFDAWNNNTVVFLGISNEYSMRLWRSKLLEANKTFSQFKEPDLRYALTSIACVDTGEIFKDLKIA